MLSKKLGPETKDKTLLVLNIAPSPSCYSVNFTFPASLFFLVVCDPRSAVCLDFQSSATVRVK